MAKIFRAFDPLGDSKGSKISELFDIGETITFLTRDGGYTKNSNEIDIFIDFREVEKLLHENYGLS